MSVAIFFHVTMAMMLTAWFTSDVAVSKKN